MLVATGRERCVARPERPARWCGRGRDESAAAAVTRRRGGSKRRQPQCMEPASRIDEIEHAAGAARSQPSRECSAIAEMHVTRRDNLMRVRRGLSSEDRFPERVDNRGADYSDRQQGERDRRETWMSPHGQGQSIPTASGCPPTALARAAMPMATARRSSSSVGPAGCSLPQAETNSLSSAT